MNEIEQQTRAVAHHYDRLAANGPYATLAPGNRGGNKSRYVAAVFDAALLRALSPLRPTRLLDFGCGTGIFTRKCAALAEHVIGVDISAGMRAQAKALCAGLDNVAIIASDGATLALADASVDVIVAREALCYVPDPQLGPLVAELHRVTAPGGRLLWLEQVSRDPGFQHHLAAPHLVKRDPDAIVALATRHGWRLAAQRLVRTPRFPWIYPLWLGLVPRRAIPALAAAELALHGRRRQPLLARRWWNVLFEFEKVADEHV